MDSQTLASLASASIAAIAAIAAAAIAGYWGYRSVVATSDASKLKDESAKLKRELIQAYRQIAAYHQLEHELATHISSLGESAAKTIKTQFRNKVVELLDDRPEMSAKTAATRIKELEI